jgi:hypothetical protein
MQLRFLQGDPTAPRGHAILFTRSSTAYQRVFAVYCVVIPIKFPLSKFLPPILAAQIPPEGLQEATRANFVPIPPGLEESESQPFLEALAELRGDDLCEILTTINPDDETTRLTMPAEAGEVYTTLYTHYAEEFLRTRQQAQPESTAKEVPLDDLDVNALLGSLLSDRDRLNELAKLTGTARYALEGRDKRLLQETEQQMRRVGRPLPEKYRTPELIKAALEDGERGRKLAQLYLDRSYKLLDEQYNEIPELEREIRELKAGEGA